MSFEHFEQNSAHATSRHVQWVCMGSAGDERGPDSPKLGFVIKDVMGTDVQARLNPQMRAIEVRYLDSDRKMSHVRLESLDEEMVSCVQKSGALIFVVDPAGGGLLDSIEVDVPLSIEDL